MRDPARDRIQTCRECAQSKPVEIGDRIPCGRVHDVCNPTHIFAALPERRGRCRRTPRTRGGTQLVALEHGGSFGYDLGRVANTPTPSRDVSRRMRLVRQGGTSPELAVRRIVTDLGLRYRTCVKNLPGSPDLANRTQGWAIFVHGCFWHGHERCRLATVPKTSRSWWEAKFAANRARDRKKQALLTGAGLRVAIVWQCELDAPERVAKRLRKEIGAR